MRKVSRFHRDIHFPDWSEEVVSDFLQQIKRDKSLTFSLHSVDKTVDYVTAYGKVFWKRVKGLILNFDFKFSDVFEFYSLGKEIKKACIRVSTDKFPVDIVMVVSDKNIVTLYCINKDDDHKSLNKSLYEKGEE